MEGYQTQLYKRRWAFLTALIAMQLLIGWGSSCFGQISNFYARYFHVSYSQVDWMTIGSSVGPVFSTVPFAWLACKGYLGFRNLAIFSAVTTTLGYFCLALSTIARTCFSLAVLSQVVSSFAGQVSSVITPVFAVHWFPEKEVGTAISANMVGGSLGTILGLLVPANVLDLKFSNLTSNDKKVARDNNTLRIMYACFTAVSLAISLIFVFFATDRPPKPPTIAQSLKLNNGEKKKAASGGFWEQTKLIMTNKTYVLASIGTGILYTTPVIEFTMMAQIIQPFVSNHDVMGAYVMTILCTGGVIGALASGKVVNVYKRYGVISVVGSGVSFLASVALVVAVYFKSYVWICLTNFILGISEPTVLVAALEISTQQTYPIDETFVSIYFAAFSFPVTVFYGEVGRVIFNAWGGVAVLIFQSVSLLLGFVLCCLYDTDNKRLNVAKLNDPSNDTRDLERTGLLELGTSSPTH